LIRGDDLSGERTLPLNEPEGEPYPRCVNHPRRAAVTDCMDCHNPLCHDCIAYSPRGSKCLECARVPVPVLDHRKVVGTVHIVSWTLLAATICGVVFYYIMSLMGLFDSVEQPSVRIMVQVAVVSAVLIVGFPVGLTAWEASAHDSSLRVRSLGALCAIWAYLFPPLLSLVIPVGFEWQMVFDTSAVPLWTTLPVAAGAAWWVISPRFWL
jgi:hypothetical protein